MPDTETTRCVHTVRISECVSFGQALMEALRWWRKSHRPVIWDVAWDRDMLIIYHDGFELPALAGEEKP